MEEVCCRRTIFHLETLAANLHIQISTVKVVRYAQILGLHIFSLNF